jgi:hypothetical protein|nr:MAG TPA: GatD-like protein [Caudoviricetes sp.]
MEVKLNDNFKWFLESLLNEGFDQFFIDDMYGAVFTKNGKVRPIDCANFITSNLYSACPDLKENTEYNIKDFIEGKLINNNFEFGDKIIVKFNGQEYEGIFVRKRGEANIVVIKEFNNQLAVTNKAIKKAE